MPHRLRGAHFLVSPLRSENARARTPKHPGTWMQSIRVPECSAGCERREQNDLEQREPARETGRPKRSLRSFVGPGYHCWHRCIASLSEHPFRGSLPAMFFRLQKLLVLRRVVEKPAGPHAVRRQLAWLALEHQAQEIKTPSSAPKHITRAPST